MNHVLLLVRLENTMATSIQPMKLNPNAFVDL